jgi:exopolyphosphatase / guanosine-5'-triphosphate,3'-diphosphate pyrophosphatase
VIEKLQSFLREQFTALDWFKSEPGMMIVGEGGTLRLVGRLAQKLAGYPMDELHGYRAARNQVEAVCGQLAKSTVEARKRMAGMKADRADISLGGALVIQEALRVSGFDEMMICSQGLREGIFYERFLAGEGAPIFEKVREASVLNLAHLYRFQEKHSKHVAYLTLSMFDQIAPPRNVCGATERELLWAASMLHDIGVSVDYNDHHKHSAYLILNAGLPGYSHRELALIALLARYHRKGKPSTDEFALMLQPEDDRKLLQLSALLRIAEQMERSRDGVVQDVAITMGANWAQMELMTRGDGQVALWAVERNRDIFEQAFDVTLEVTATPVTRRD